METGVFSFRSFLQAGFECSTHVRRDGYRLDLTNATGHDRFAAADFTTLQEFGIFTFRESARWHLIEAIAGRYTFDSLAAILDAAETTGSEIILDLLHFGWPDHVEILSNSFPDKFADFTYATVRFLKQRSDRVSLFAPINEISFLSWSGGDVACLNPFFTGRAHELKRQLVRASALSSEILLNELPGVRLISPEPVIHIAGDSAIPGHQEEAEMHRLAQFEAWDMLAGVSCPELGGRPEYLDILGVNFYEKNEWIHNDSQSLSPRDTHYRAFRDLLQEVWQRYGRPIFVSETGAEDERRAGWFTYICDEVEAAQQAGVPVHGICLYPILNHPGWDDDRHCHNGLLDYPGSAGERDTYLPLADAIRLQQERFENNKAAKHENNKHRPDLPVSSPLGFRFPTSPTPHEQVRAKS